jgi:hypothetical protein
LKVLNKIKIYQIAFSIISTSKLPVTSFCKISKTSSISF